MGEKYPCLYGSFLAYKVAHFCTSRVCDFTSMVQDIQHIRPKPVSGQIIKEKERGALIQFQKNPSFIMKEATKEAISYYGL